MQDISKVLSTATAEVIEMTFPRLHTLGGEGLAIFSLQVVKPSHYNSYLSPYTSGDFLPRQSWHLCVLIPFFLFPEINMTVLKFSLHNGDFNLVHKSYARHQQMAVFLCLFEKNKQTKTPDKNKTKLLFPVLPKDRAGLMLHRQVFQRSRMPINLDRNKESSISTVPFV